MRASVLLQHAGRVAQGYAWVEVDAGWQAARWVGFRGAGRGCSAFVTQTGRSETWCFRVTFPLPAGRWWMRRSQRMDAS